MECGIGIMEWRISDGLFKRALVNLRAQSRLRYTRFRTRSRSCIPDHQRGLVDTVQPNFRHIEAYGVCLLKATILIRLPPSWGSLEECRHAVVISDLATPSRQHSAGPTTLVLRMCDQIGQVCV